VVAFPGLHPGLFSCRPSGASKADGILGEGAGRDARATAGWEAGATKGRRDGAGLRDEGADFRRAAYGARGSCGAAFPGFHPGLFSCRPSGALRWCEDGRQRE
jgi:hypothetical protein